VRRIRLVLSNPHGPAELKCGCQASTISTHPPSSHCSFSLHSPSPSIFSPLCFDIPAGLSLSIPSFLFFILPVKQITLTVHLITLHASTDHIHSFEISCTDFCSPPDLLFPSEHFISLQDAFYSTCLRCGAHCWCLCHSFACERKQRRSRQHNTLSQRHPERFLQ
jgi:hypothetical protein